MSSQLKIPGIVFLVSILCTAAGVFLYDLGVREQHRAQFERFAGRSGAELRNRILSYEHGLRGTRSALLVAGPNQTSLSQFRAIGSSRDPLREFPGARGFGYLQRVKPNEEAAFLAEAAKLGRPDLHIRQLGEHSGEWYVVKYIEPEEINRTAIGLDVASEKFRREALLVAMRSGRATLTRPITLVQADGKKGSGFLLILPVYPAHQVTADDEARERMALGAVYMPMIIDEVLTHVSSTEEGVELVLSDITDEAQRIPFYGADDQQLTSELSTVSQRFDVFGRTWLAEFHAGPKYVAGLKPNNSVALATIGLVFSLLAFYICHLMIKARSKERLEGERIRALINDAPTALAMFDSSMQYLAVSHYWCNQFELPSDDFLGRPLYEVSPNLLQSWRLAHAEALLGAKTVSDGELFHRADGSDRWLQWAIYPWHTSNGIVGGSIIFATDITDQHQLMVALDQARRESESARDRAESANRAKTLFLGNMSHEMRTPVHQLNGLLAMFKREDMSDKQSRRLEKMKISIDRLETVIGGILTLVDLESRSVQLNYKPIDIKLLCASVVQSLGAQVAQKGLAISTEFGQLPQLDVLGDERYIRTILMSYINNAITFSEKGEIVVNIARVSEDNSSVMVRISVTDHGIGIQPKKIEGLFEAFEQVDTSHTRKFGGTGIGLAIVKKAAQLMGGDAGVESVWGQGSTFWATLRLIKGTSLPQQIDDFQI